LIINYLVTLKDKNSFHASHIACGNGAVLEKIVVVVAQEAVEVAGGTNSMHVAYLLIVFAFFSFIST
jgi:hypothetical protein